MRDLLVVTRDLGALREGEVVRLEGFEPPTLCSEDRCSNPLSYSRT
jgi:hypothetical protein